MGSFNFICGFSGFPITPGEQVRVLLLTQNPYHQKTGITCYSYDHWFPRTLPIKALYDDYGSVRHPNDTKNKGIDWTGLDGDLWRKAFEIDLVIRGVGSNEYHDVAVKQGMTIHEYLDACYEDRVSVSRDVDYGRSPSLKIFMEKLYKERETKTPEGIPTMERIEAELGKLGLVDAKGKKVGFYVDSEIHGEVCVRLSDPYNVPGAVLEQVHEHLAKTYASMVYAGTYHAELILRPKPGTKDFHGLRRDFSQEPLAVGYSMIREDIWQETLKLSTQVEHYDNKNGYKRFTAPLEAYVEALEALYTEQTQILKNGGKWEKRTLFTMGANDNWLLNSVLKDPIPFALGLGTMWRLFVENAEKYPEAERKIVLRDFAEMACFQDVAMHLHYDWRLSRYGSQTVEIKHWAQAWSRFARVARDAAKAWAKKYAE